MQCPVTANNDDMPYTLSRHLSRFPGHENGICKETEYAMPLASRRSAISGHSLLALPLPDMLLTITFQVSAILAQESFSDKFNINTFPKKKNL